MIHIDPPRPCDYDDWDHGDTAAEWGQYYIQIACMIFNHRIVVVDKRSKHSYRYGWCYDTYDQALLAIRLWDPQTQHTPPGWKKRSHGVHAERVAPQPSPPRIPFVTNLAVCERNHPGCLDRCLR